MKGKYRNQLIRISRASPLMATQEYTFNESHMTEIPKVSNKTVTELPSHNWEERANLRGFILSVKESDHNFFVIFQKKL